VEPGLAKVADQFRRETSNRVRIQFFAAPQLERRLQWANRPTFWSPSGIDDDQLRRGKSTPKHTPSSTSGDRRHGARRRTRSRYRTLDRFKQSLLGADSIVYNHASTGLYWKNCSTCSGCRAIEDEDHALRQFAQVLEHVIGGKGIEIGFGTIAEIRQFEPKGLRLVGPLPEQVQNSTAYSAGDDRRAGSRDRDGFRGYIGTPAAKAAFSAAGID